MYLCNKEPFKQRVEILLQPRLSRRSTRLEIKIIAIDADCLKFGRRSTAESSKNSFSTSRIDDIYGFCAIGCHDRIIRSSRLDFVPPRARVRSVSERTESTISLGRREFRTRGPTRGPRYRERCEFLHHNKIFAFRRGLFV